MDILQNLADKVAYSVRNATYDPAAEEYAASRRAAQESEEAARKAKDQKEARQKAKTDAEAAEEERKAKEAADRASRSQFNTGRFVGKVTGTVTTILIYFAIIAGAIWGANLATNLNLYRSWPYRLLYAVYGAVFFPIVIIYVLGYRWFWKGKKPRYYALLPLIPYYINQPILAKLLSWMSYKPDDVVDAFQEWNGEMVQKGKEAQEAAALEDNRAAAAAAKKAAEDAAY